jgi:multisubunit Na+/H+ antiporter MnhG subunit
MIAAKHLFGVVLSTLAWLLGVVVVFIAVIYALFVVMWLHAPIVMVLLGFAWFLNKMGRKFRGC